MNEKQKKAIKLKMSELVEDLQGEIEPLMTYFQEKRVISSGTRDVLDGEKTKAKKLIDLLAILQGKDNGWKFLLMYLYRSGNEGTARMLQKSAEEAIKTVDEKETIDSDRSKIEPETRTTNTKPPRLD